MRAVVGPILGLIVGVAVVLAVLAYRAAVEEVYVHGLGDIVGWVGLPGSAGTALGVWAAHRLDARAFWRVARTVVAALGLGAALGALLGDALASHASGPWAGGLIGAGSSVVLGLLALAVRARFGAARTALAGALLLPVLACSGPPPAPDDARTLPAPDPSRVEAAIFLLGDPGVARAGTYPIMRRVRRDIERWSAAVGREGDVALLVLGDILYPEGLHAEGSEPRRRDSLRLADQIGLVSGPRATEAGTRAIFIPGNHDWGRREDRAGAVRLARLRDFLERWQGTASGRLELSPEPGHGGPGVVDLGSVARLVLLDTAWWLLGSEPRAERAVIEGVGEALRTAGDRRVVVAAHHPLESGGPHGTGLDLVRSVGLRPLLEKAGILLQDLSSRPYGDLEERLVATFREAGPPAVFAAGHDHSVQVFSSPALGCDRHLVVGSASKLTDVSGAPGMVFGRSEPAYAKLLFLDDGSIHLRVEAAPAEYLSCADVRGGSGSAVASCMERGVEAYRTVWAEELEAGG